MASDDLCALPARERWWESAEPAQDTGAENGIRTVVYSRLAWEGESRVHQYAVVRYWDVCGERGAAIDVILCRGGGAEWYPLG